MKIRPRRSVLFMPGTNNAALEKARSLPTDGIIIDLEDAVAPEAKTVAREQAMSALEQGGYGKRELVLRINPLDSRWGADDLIAAARLSEKLDAVLLPKVERASQVRDLAKALDEAGAREDLAIWVMAETPSGVTSIDEVAGGHQRLECIVIGTSDLVHRMRARHTLSRIALLAPLNLCVLAARAHGVDILDGVHLDLDDETGLKAVCQQGRDMGFDGKTLIHPSQLAAANAAFSPRQAEVDQARDVLSAWEAASAQGEGVAVVNGRLIERLHVEEAKRVIALAEFIAQMD